MSIFDRTGVFFRLDASSQIGLGHLRRCLSLASYISKYGATCFFLCREESRKFLLQSRIPENAVFTISARNESEDALESLAHVERLSTGNTVIVLDSYELSASWEKCILAEFHSLLVIDDLRRPHASGVIELDQNLREDVPLEFWLKWTYLNH